MRKAALCALALLPLSAFGCTALLGDFDVAPRGNGPGTDGAADDGTTTDGGTDGPSDANDPDAFDAQSTVFTTCGVSAPRLVEQIDDPVVGFGGELAVFRMGPLVRIVAQTMKGEGAVVYTFDSQINGGGGTGPLQNVQKLDLQGEGRYFDVRRLGNQAILALLFMERHVDQVTVHMKVDELPDNNALAFQSIRVSQDFQGPPQSGGGQIGGTLGGYQNNNEYFWALGGVPSIGSPGKYDLFVGHRPSASAIPAPVLVHTTADDRETRLREMARSQTTQYIFNDRGPDTAADKGTSYFPVPQDTTTAVAPVALQPPGGTKPYVLIGASGIATGDGIRVAAAEVDFSNPGNFGVVKAGLVSQADLNAGWDGSKIPNAFTLSSLTDVPAESSARFFGDELLWLGSPPEPLKGKGLNFIWFNTTTRVIRSKVTGTQRLLTDHLSIGRSSIALTTQTAVNAELDVVFYETTADNKSALLYTKMSCIR